MGEMRNAYRILVGNLMGRDHLEDLGIYGRIIIKWILKQWDMTVITGFIWQRTGSHGKLLLTLYNFWIP